MAGPGATDDDTRLALTRVVDAQRAYIDSYRLFERAPDGERRAELARAEARLDAHWDELVKSQF